MTGRRLTVSSLFSCLTEREKRPSFRVFDVGSEVVRGWNEERSESLPVPARLEDTCVRLRKNAGLIECKVWTALKLKQSLRSAAPNPKLTDPRTVVTGLPKTFNSCGLVTGVTLQRYEIFAEKSSSRSTSLRLSWSGASE